MVSIRFEVDSSTRTPYVLPQNLNNKFNIKECSNNDKLVTIENPRGMKWNISKFNVIRVVEVVLGCKSITELKKDYENFKKLTKFQRKLHKILQKLIKTLKRWDSRFSL